MTCQLLITFANSLVIDQAQQNSLMVILKEFFFEKVNSKENMQMAKKKNMQN